MCDCCGSCREPFCCDKYCECPDCFVDDPWPHLKLIECSKLPDRTGEFVIVHKNKSGQIKAAIDIRQDLE